MPRFVLCALALCGVALCGLGGCADFGSFVLPIEVAEQRVQGSPVGGLGALGLFEVPIPVDVDLAAETAARDTGPARAIRLDALSLSVTTTAEPDGDTDDLGFIGTVDIFVESRDAELPRVRVATLDAVAPGSRRVEFETLPSVDLLPYVQSGARLTSEAEGTLPPDDVTFDGEIVLVVEVL